LLADLRNFILWLVIIVLIIGVLDTLIYHEPEDNDTENIIIRPSYDRSFMSVISGKQE
jgi:hypothetical protein